MKKLHKIVCDACKITIKASNQMTDEDWEELEKQDFHLCTKCTEEFGNTLRLKELELAKDYLNSDYYWKRVKELSGLSIEEYTESFAEKACKNASVFKKKADEALDIMKFNSNQTT